MADSFWNRQQHLLPSAGMLKRPRTDYDMPPSAGLPSGREMHDYIEQDDDRAGPWALKDTGTIGSAYDCYLQSAQLSSFTTGEASAHRGVGLVRAVGGGMPAHTMTDLSLMVLMGSGGPDLLPNRGGDPLILCFVDFASPACASTALSALQGYKMDEINPECNYLGLQFSRYPGSRSGPGSRGKR